VAAAFQAAAFPVIAAFRASQIGCLGQICLNAYAIGVCSSSAQCKDDEASEENGFERHEHADTPKLKNVPEWSEQEMPRNDTKFQAQPERANSVTPMVGIFFLIHRYMIYGIWYIYIYIYIWYGKYMVYGIIFESHGKD